MRLQYVCAVVLASPLAALAHRHHDIAVQKRQASASSTTSHASSATSVASHSSGSSSPAATPTALTTSQPAAQTPASSSPASHPTVTGGASASDAMPLESIVPASQVSTQPSVPLPSTAAGAKPSGLPNAPAIPSLSSWNPSKYPASDKPPPTNSPEVIEWIDQVRNSGVVIPNIAPFAAGDGMCNIPANAGRVGNATECWWTCGHCERKTDIVNCKQRMTWGSSFDDGPAPDTPRLLQYLEREKLKTTFFVVGSRVKDRPNMLQTAYALGHTIGVHTWSHTSLTTQTTEAIIAELGWSKQIVKDALGVTPYYFRPPYGDIDDRVRAIAYAMDLVPVIWTVAGGQSYDTFDWEVPGGMKTAVDSVNQFLTILSHASALPTGFIVLEHDLWWEQVELAVGYFLPSARAEKFTVTSINACNNQPLAGMYVETAGANAKLPAGTGNGQDMSGWGQVAPTNAPLGGSDGSNSNPTVSAGEGKPTTSADGQGAGEGGAFSSLRPADALRVVAAVGLAALIAGAAAL